VAHEEIYRIIADSAYEEHMEQENNVEREQKDCPYYNTGKTISEEENSK